MHTSVHTGLASFAHNTSHKTTENFLIHTHSDYEIYYFISGEADYLIDGKEIALKPHTILLIAPNVFHGVRVNTQVMYERYTLHLDPNILSVERRHLLLSVFPKQHRGGGVGTSCCLERMERSGVLEIMRAFEACSLQEKDVQKALSPVLTEALLTILLLCAQPIATDEQAQETGRVSRTQKDVIDYLNAHFTESITLDMLSERFYISKHYLNRAFRKATGTTVMDYLIHKRVTYVQQLLINGIPVSQAAALAGFGDYTSFYRAYVKRFGHAPSHDRAMTASCHGSVQHVRTFIKEQAQHGVLSEGESVEGRNTPAQQDDSRQAYLHLAQLEEREASADAGEFWDKRRTTMHVRARSDELTERGEQKK